MLERQPSPSNSLPSPPGPESSWDLLLLARQGDADACNKLFSRYRQSLARWAHGRLPGYARELMETEDLVQVALSRALRTLGTFEPRHRGALLAYLRQAIVNQIRDEIRRARRTPAREELDENFARDERTPLEMVIGREDMGRYEAAKARLSEDQREAVVMRLELGMTYQEVADELGRSTANAARQLIARALLRLARLMGDD